MKTNKTFFKKIIAQLKSDNVKNLFAIMNDVNSQDNKYSKYYSRNYTYGYGYGYGYTSSSNKKSKKKGADKYFQYYQDDEKM